MKFLQKNSYLKKYANVKKGLVFLLILSLTLLFASCGQSTGGSEEGENDASCEDYYLFNDDMGRRIVLHSKPQKVAVLFSSYADIWVSAGGSVDVTVGEAVERGFAKEGVVLVDEGAGKTINTELLIAAKPDFVICSADIEAQVEVAELLNENGIPAACFRVDEFADYMDMLKICTDITGDTHAYKTNGTDVEAQISELLERVTKKEDEKTILFIRAGSSASATKAKTAKDNFVCVMLKELETVNIAEEVPLLLDGLSIEEILVKNPDYIFISTMGNEEAAIANMMSVFSGKEWQALDAVKNEQYTFLPKDLFQYKPNARWAEAYEYLVDILYDEE